VRGIVLKAIEEAESRGIRLRLVDGKVKVAFPASARHQTAPVLAQLRANRNQVIEALKERDAITAMPTGVRLISWRLAKPPVAIERCSIVNDPTLFARRTLEQLDAALSEKHWLAGNWSVAELVQRLCAVGVIVEVNRPLNPLGKASVEETQLKKMVDR
jgi:hypothetical protein